MTHTFNSSAKNNGRFNWIVFGIALLSAITIVVANVIAQTFNTVHKSMPLELRMIIFILSIAIYSICQFILLHYVRNETRSLFQNKATLKKIHFGIKLIQLFFIIGAAFLIIDLSIESKYNLIIIIFSTIVSYSSASLLMIMLSIKLFHWISKGRSKTVLLYAISALLLAFNLVSSLIYENISFFYFARSLDNNNGLYIGEYPGNNSRHAVSDIAVKYIYLISSISAFIANWLAAASLLRNYYSRSQVLFWILIAIPMVIFISQYTPFLLLILEQIFNTPGEIIMGYTIAYTVAESVGGILIGISFWITGRAINNPRIKNYMYISAIGYTLLFSSNYVINAASPSYPPFGLVGILYVGLSAYLIFIGIYSAALSMAHNNELRRFVKKSIKKEGILGNIGTSEKYLEIENNVIGASKKLSNELSLQSGIDPTLGDAEIKRYVEEIISEIRGSKA
jgi:hypothetical protein